MFIHNYFRSYFTAVWLTALATVPATARHPAICVMTTGNPAGTANTPALTALKNNPAFLNFLKKPGVGLLILFITLRISFSFNS